MKRNVKVGRTIAFFPAIVIMAVLALMTAVCAVGVHAEEQETRRTVKVAVLNDSIYADQDENGNWSGIDVERMIDISQKAGFDVEFIDSSADPDFMGNLDNGTYDIVADVAITPEREEQYLFTDEEMGTNNSTLTVRTDDNRWDYGNIEQISEMKIGVVSTYSNNAEFRSWCQKHDVSPEITEYKTITDMTDALRNGELDGEVISVVGGEDYSEQYRTILKFLQEPYAFAFRKDDIELKNEVDAAVALILSGDAEYFTELKNKYETQFKSNILPFSSSEKQYIADHPVMKIAVVENEMPYYKKNADGSDDGIIPDYYGRLSEWTGLKFSYATYATYDEAVESVQNNENDILGIYGNGLISANRDKLSLTDRISSITCILLTNPGGDITGKQRLATAATISEALKPGIARIFPDSTMTEYADTQACFDAVKSQEADAVLAGLYSTTWLTNQMNSTTYSIIPISGISYDLCAAVRKDDQMLCSILNKGIAATKGDFIGIATKDTLPEDDLRTTISRIPPGIIVSVVSVLLVLVIGLTWAIIMLGKRQKERTAVLAAQAETEKQKLLVAEIEKNTDDRNRFFANISHDMRTPLNAVLGFASLAQKDDITEETRKEYISKIQMSGSLLLELINDTLTLSKANSGKLELTPEPVRAKELFESIIIPIRQTAEKKGVFFTADFTGAADRIILVDRLNFQKILLNLLSNAVKFTPEGGHVSICFYDEPQKTAGAEPAMHHEPEQGSGAEPAMHHEPEQASAPDSVIRVLDDGIGMDPEFLPHIFEPYAQEKRQGYESMGTGLGLSIVKSLVELMGGTIRVESVKGKGTVFTIRVHFEEAKAGAAVEKEEVLPRNGDLSGRRILLCEDNALNREIAIALLKDKNMIVDTAENGKEGVQKFMDSTPGFYDAILMDIRMPVMGGIEAAKLIRRSGKNDAESIPIIAMTADAFRDDIQKCLDAGMDAHLAKPVDPGQLYAALGYAFGQING